jgi:hypothetical protein
MTRCPLLASDVVTSSHARTSSGKPCNRMIGKPWESPFSSKPTFRTGVWTVRVLGAVGPWALDFARALAHTSRVSDKAPVSEPTATPSLRKSLRPFACVPHVLSIPVSK